MRLRLTTRPSWPELRARLADALPPAFPSTEFALSDDAATPEVSWHEGPAEGSVAAAVGDVPGWRVESVLLGPDPDAANALTPLRLARSFSDRAWALAVVRFQACDVRPFDRTRPGAAEKLWAILEEDDPTAPRWPLVEAITDLLVADPEPVGPPAGGTEADHWSWKLQAIGYDRLWSRAWATAAL